MNRHPDNPSGNQLPPGVDESQLLDAVRASGYPLQSLVAQALKAHFHVVEEWGFADRTTKEHRTLDVYAFCELGDKTGRVHPRLHLLVECKRSDLPFVFFPPGVQREPWDFPEVVGVGRFSLDLGNNTTQDASPAKFFCAADSRFVTAPCRWRIAHRAAATLEPTRHCGDQPCPYPYPHQGFSQGQRTRGVFNRSTSREGRTCP